VQRRITFAVVVDNRPYQWSDPAFLQSEQYRSEANLRARQSIYEHQQPRVNLPQAVMDIVAPNPDEVVVDVGCGNGAYLAELGRRGHRGPIVGIDFSQGMLRAAREAMPAAHPVLADARALPVSDGAATLALAMHMLYHVPEPAVAVNEMRRALGPGGRLVVALNADDHLSALRLAVEQARHDAGLPERAFGEHLLLSDGAELLGQVFGSVKRHDFVAELVLTDLGPMEAYIGSMIDTSLVPKDNRDAYVRAVIGHLPSGPSGVVRVRTHPGCLVCS